MKETLDKAHERAQEQRFAPDPLDWWEPWIYVGAVTLGAGVPFVLDWIRS